MHDRRNALLFIAIGLVIFSASVWAHDAVSHHPFLATNIRDFKSFYCAGEAVLQRADPYRVEPLRACSHRVVVFEPAWLVVPAPLPGYALALFAVFATLPFQIASIAYEGLLVASVLVGALALARLTGWSPFVMLLVLIPTDGYLNLSYGGFMPLVIAALCVGALALERGAFITVGVCSGIAMIEPHVALPAFLAVMIGSPRSRIPMAAVAVVLAAFSVVAVGVKVNFEYFVSELPAVALGEVSANDQYSLTRVLAAVGMQPERAISIGTASFVIMLLVGVALALRLAKYRRAAYLILLPPVAAMLGGSYIHDVQLVGAIPLALLLGADLPVLRVWSFGAVMLLLLPATSHRFAAFPAPAVFTMLAMVSLVELIKRSRPERVRWQALAAQIAILIVLGLLIRSGLHQNATTAKYPALRPMPGPAISASAFAPQVWGAFLAQMKPEHGATHYLLEKIPGWIAIATIVGCALQLAIARKQRKSALSQRAATEP